VALPYSSGTTGVSKGVVLTHRNLVANIDQVLSGAPLRPDEVTICVLPMFHIYGMSSIMNTSLAAGITIVTMPRFDLVQFLELHAAHGVTRSYIAPPIAVALAKPPIVDQYALRALELIISGAAPLSAELSDEVAARLHCTVGQGYGMTELSPVSHMCPLGAARAGTVGVLTANTEMRIIDVETGIDLGPDADGELWIRGPQVMAGYLNNPDATTATITDDGWLRTGDIARVDPDGYVRIVDRLKELIKYKGFQVPPAELEALLLTHPAVADAAVVGMPDDVAGEIPAAFVVCKPGSEVGEAELCAFVAGQVAHHKQIRRLTFVEAIPKSASGKILRRLLRDG
jgi:acyl-CoA synthetase (AMP-forming)/AMP-acid ligase II